MANSSTTLRDKMYFNFQQNRRQVSWIVSEAQNTQVEYKRVPESKVMCSNTLVQGNLKCEGITGKHKTSNQSVVIDLLWR